MSEPAFVIVHPMSGVFIGIGPDFRLYWSRTDDGNQNAAVAFETEQEAESVMSCWPNGRPRTARLVKVLAELNEKGQLHASERSCRIAGAGSWLNYRTPVEGRAQ